MITSGPALVEAAEQAGDEDEGEERGRDPQGHVHVPLEVGAQDGRQLDHLLLRAAGRRRGGLRRGARGHVAWPRQQGGGQAA